MIFDAVRSLGLEHGRFVTGCQASHGFEGEEAILCSLADFHAELIAQGVHELIRAAQSTRQVCADLHAIFAFLLIMIQRIKTNQRSNIRLCDAYNLRHILHRGFCEIAFFALCQIEQWHHRRAFMLWRVFGKDLFYFIRIFCLKTHRSISPSTISIEAKMAIRSATRCPLTIFGSTDKLSNEGVRQWTRRGLALPSPSSKTPNSPRGDSTA